MTLLDNPSAIAAAIKAYRDSAFKYTMMNIRQGPGEGNYDHIEELRICDAIRAAEEVAVLDKQDMLDLKLKKGS